MFDAVEAVNQVPYGPAQPFGVHPLFVANAGEGGGGRWVELGVVGGSGDLLVELGVVGGSGDLLVGVGSFWWKWEVFGGSGEFLVEKVRLRRNHLFL